tara:strand:+ start:44 stop:706 length:663 start_codon:yes stop_codon:yes gene_type:complete
MKYTITLFFLIFSFININAQTEKGTFLIDGGIGTDFVIAQLAGIDDQIVNTDVYSNIKSKISSSFSAGYFLTSTICIGTGSAYEYSENNIKFYDDKQSIKNEMLMIYPVFLRTYFGDNFWSQLKYGIGTSNTVQESENLLTITTLTTKTPLTDLSLTFGYAIYLNNVISINPNIGYEIKTQKNRLVNASGTEFNLLETWGGLAFNFDIVLHFDRMFYHWY